MSAFNVYNHEDIDSFLRGAAGHDEKVSRLLIQLLKKPLLSHESSIQPLTQLEQNAPSWLCEKFHKGEQLYIFNSLSDPQLHNNMQQVAKWVALAIEHKLNWTTHENPGRPLQIHTVEDAVKAALLGTDQLTSPPEQKPIPKKPDPTAGTLVDLDFPDGWKIRRLFSPESKAFEGDRLHHCANSDEYANADVRVYSLRDPDENSIVTLEIRDEAETTTMGAYHFSTVKKGSDYLFQARGLQNQPADPETLPYIEAFYKHHKLNKLADAGLTGIAMWYGKFHSVYNLPHDMVLQGLDLSWVTKPITLPENLHVKGNLSIRATHIPAHSGVNDIKHNIIFPQNLIVDKKIIFSIRHKGKYHASGAPSYVECDGVTKIRVREKYFIDGALHSQNGLAADTEFDSRTGKPTVRRWFKYDVEHNDDGPSFAEYTKDGRIKNSRYSIDGLKHNPFGTPSITSDPKTGKVVLEEWYHRGSLHSDHGPALIRYDAKTGHVIERSWYQHGTKHNEYGPAHIVYDKNTGAITKKEWYWSGELHNANGPAVLYYDEVGNISGQKTHIAYDPLNTPKPSTPDFAL